MSSVQIPILVENRADELTAQGIFAELLRSGEARVIMCWDSSSQISLASGFLLRNPLISVALIFNCRQEPDEFRLPIDRILTGTAPQERWHAALAIPDTTAWPLLDKEFAKRWAVLQAAAKPDTRTERAVQFKEWLTEGNQFNLEEARRADAELDGLCRFLETHIHSLTTA